MREIGVENEEKRGESKPAHEDPSRHLIWRYTNLYYTCRNMLWIPITRSESGLSPIGLLKIENRTPRGIRGFSLSAGPGQLFFEDLWALAALRPYLSDLYKNKEDLFTPVHNNEAWRLRYLDNPPGLGYFDSLREWLKKKEPKIKAKNEKEQAQEKEMIRKKYKDLSDNLKWLLRFLCEAEPLLQNIAYAHAVLASEHRTHYLPPDTPPAPSFFNAHNLGLAILNAEVEYGCVVKESVPISPDVEVRKFEISPKSVAGQFKHKLRELAIAFPEGKVASQGAAVPQLLREVKTKLIDIQAIPRDIAAFLGEPSNGQVKWDFTSAAERLREQIIEFARTFQDSIVCSFSPSLDELKQSRRLTEQQEARYQLAHARLLMEQKVARRLTEEILQIDSISAYLEVVQMEIKDRALKECQLVEEERASRAGKQNPGVEQNSPSEGELQSRVDKLITPETATLLLLSKLSALVTMGAHTFDEKDAYRLMFIAGHVSQVLDNNLMQQARQRNIPAGYSDFAVLGLDRASLDWLYDLQINAVQVAQTLTYLLNRDRQRQETQGFALICEPLDLRVDLLMPIRERQTDIRMVRDRPEESSAPLEVKLLTLKGKLPDDTSPTLGALFQWQKRDAEGGHRREDKESKVEKMFNRETGFVSLRIPISLFALSVPLWLIRILEAINALEQEVQSV